MPILNNIISTIVIGFALAILFYWSALLTGRITGDRGYFKWWVKVIIIQGIVLAVALKMLKIL